MRTAVILGGAGFLGSHLAEALIDLGMRVVVVDNLSSGRIENVRKLLTDDHFEFVHADVSESIRLDLESVEEVFNLASPASPPHYMLNRVETLKAGSLGVFNAIELSLRYGARLIHASTSEVYGDPTVHPQNENYWGNANPIGERSCYDESKRFAEALCVASSHERGLNVGIARIFNTFGPRLSPSDGRVISNFVSQALEERTITIYGDGTQTRSFCYVSDLIDGLIRLARASTAGPINIGNPRETSVLEVAEMVIQMTGSSSKIAHLPLPADDPVKRRPDITRAKAELSWFPSVDLETGLRLTIDWFESELKK